MALPFQATEISLRLLSWYGKEGRVLPWRENRDPYRIWLSEIMLQQTTVAAVIPYYARFLQRFPTIESLASAPLDDVISLWAGLGYYSRARNLHRGAQKIVSEHADFPDTLEGLLALPGIGRSTAGAILSIAFDKPAPILDGNVRRVLVRLFAWQEDPRSSRAEKQLWQWAEALTPEEHPHDYAQAIMDLGATVCVPRTPLCESCPLRELCQAFKQGCATLLPVARKQGKLPVRRQVALLVKGSGGYLLRQRPTEGFLGGLWEFPVVEVSPEENHRQAAERLLADLGLVGEACEAEAVRHAYSHFKLEMAVFSVEIEKKTFVAEAGEYAWYREDELKRLPLHGAHKKAYSK
jgi:A/G-specific adenine glycosylase